MLFRSSLFAAALLAALVVPAAAQPVAPLYQSARDTGASPADAQALAAAISAEKAILRASNAGSGDIFGNSVSVSGDVAVVGAPYESGLGDATAYSGAAYVFERSAGGVWAETAILRASNADANDYFGWSVSVSDGVIVVGAYAERGPDNATTRRGAAYVFERSAAGAWAETALLRANEAPIVSGADFGYSVSVSGDVIVVGATQAGPTQRGFYGVAYVFERTAGGAWSDAAILRASNAGDYDQFGYSVSVSGNVAVVGALNADGAATNTGAAYVFERSTAGAWTETALLSASNAQINDQFGRSVSVSGGMMVVGAPQEDGSTNATSNSGAAYVFERSAAGAWTETALLRSSTVAQNEQFGSSVSVSGDVAVVGSPQEPSFTYAGAARVFERTAGGAWPQTAVLRASNAGSSDRFGYSVSVSDGVALVGAIGEDGPTDATSGAGAAYVFGPPATTVTQGGLYNPSSAPDDGKGFRLLGAPIGGVTVTDLAGLNLVQGVPAGTDPAAFPAQYSNATPNLLITYDGDTTFTSPDADDVLAPGRGFFWYLFDRDISSASVPASFGTGTSTSSELTGFALSATGTPLAADVEVAFADNTDPGDDDFHMLANPFARPLAVSGISASGGTIQGGDVFYAFDPSGGGSYVTLTTGDRLSVWQGAFAELVPSASGGAVTVTYAYASTDTGAPPPFYGRGAETAAAPSVRFALAGALASGTPVTDRAAVVRFLDGAVAGFDAFDASKLTPPISDLALLAPTVLRDGQPQRLAVDSRSPLEAASVPLALRTTDAGVFALSWTADLPDGWTATLADARTGRTVDLTSATDLAFTTDAAQDWAERFTLTVTPGNLVATDGAAAAAVALSAPRPNPATRSAALTLTLDAPQHVRASVLDALGREVQVVLDAEASGSVRLDVDTSALAPGVYVVRVTGASFAETRRLTVVH